jgi:ABC-type proline/glycine betaine transport system permease subunit
MDFNVFCFFRLVKTTRIEPSQRVTPYFIFNAKVFMSEKCPFCMSTVNEGATVCTGCGAYKARKGGGCLSTFFFIFVVTIVFAWASKLLALSAIGQQISIAIYIGVLIFGVLAARKDAQKIRWWRRQ